MGRPGSPENKNRTVIVYVRFSPDLHRRLADAAHERDLSINFLVNRAVEEFLDALIPLDEVVWTRRSNE